MIDIAKFVMYRNLAHMSQADLAEEAGVSQQLIASIETGQSRTSKSIYKIAAALNVPVDQLDPDIPAWDVAFSEAASNLRKLPKPESDRIIRGLNREIAKSLKKLK